jgi:DNA-binding transcriptional ArsR family regulator
MTYDAVLDALADSTRRTILERLRDGERSVVDLARALPVSRPAVSQHLKRLKHAGLVAERKSGTRNLYHVKKEGFEVLKRYLDDYWEPVLKAFQDYTQRQGD